jgi:hypothetical protein
MNKSELVEKQYWHRTIREAIDYAMQHEME